MFSGHMSPGDVLYHGMPYQLIMFAGSQRKQRSLPYFLLIFIEQEIIELMREQNIV